MQVMSAASMSRHRDLKASGFRLCLDALPTRRDREQRKLGVRARSSRWASEKGEDREDKAGGREGGGGGGGGKWMKQGEEGGGREGGDPAWRERGLRERRKGSSDRRLFHLAGHGGGCPADGGAWGAGRTGVSRGHEALLQLQKG